MDLRELAVKVSAVVSEAGTLAYQDQMKPHDFIEDARKDRSRKRQYTTVDDRLVRFCHERINAIHPYECWEEAGSDRKPGERYWCIGRIDGAINYMRNMPEWTVTVSLFEVDEDGTNVPILGVVHAPVQGLTYMAAKGYGAIRIRSTALGEKREKIMPSTTATLRESVVSFGMSYFPDESKRALNTAAALAGKPADIKRVGPVSMDLCKVADGTYDAYFEPSLHSWDVPGVSAGAVILREAQGRLERWDGSDIVWGASNDVVASNGPIMDELRPYLR
ncbi:inositol monophosphatase family protein [Bifidobacterium sp. SMB2]|uniref:Inositol monophosphatase family protein n=1 Tax=Bifidobacterium saimiriisciurei TaxID=2661627 RepID=A0ABX0C9V0_9BIFI|nr:MULTISPECIES: inositol monophosphatase family protein [Bifidobacterium]NEG95596.1 inositol monophosphatase family protein [Bifidobacterium sp. SMB2]NEH11909.1 inositol monophosphatase family protein [Bifidobacterium saimiriisciurei]